MFVLEAPYVSRPLRDAVRALGLPVLDTDAARQDADGMELLGDADFARAWRASADPRLYTNSENALPWIEEHLADTPLPRQIRAMKDKVRFRELAAAVDPGFRFAEVAADALDGFDVEAFGLPLVVKPAVGFFSLGVEVVARAADWPAAVRRLRAAAERFAGLYPAAVLDLDRFVVEELVEGEEYAVDAYFDGEGEAVVVDVYAHPFADGADVRDRVYWTGPEVIERTHGPLLEHLQGFGRAAGLRGVPVHVEYRIDAAGTVRPIEANPMRFGGWCASDMASYAWGFCPYRTFANSLRPDWGRLCEERRGRATGLVVAEVPDGVDRRRARFDHERFVARFSRPLELRRVEDPRQPVWAFLFVEVDAAGGGMEELDAALRADLREYVVED